MLNVLDMYVHKFAAQYYCGMHMYVCTIEGIFTLWDSFVISMHRYEILDLHSVPTPQTDSVGIFYTMAIAR